jgi:hypothetical protein
MRSTSLANYAGLFQRLEVSMKRTRAKFAAASISVAAVLGSAAYAAGVTVQIGEPGYCGRLEIGDAPKPVLISPNAVVIERDRVVQEPTYVYVPTEQRSDWAKYCAQYDACARPVYFVEPRWYNDVYVPHYKSRHELKKDAKQEYKEEKREAKREYKDEKREAKRDYQDAKREARD